MSEKGGNRLCGLMKIEDNHHKFVETRYFDLDRPNGMLNIYYERPENLPKTSREPYQVIELNMISKVSDARKAKPKAKFCFCITHAGDQFYIEANSEYEMFQWIDQLNEACKISVRDVKPTGTGAPLNSRTEIAGGVIITTKAKKDDNVEVPIDMPALSLPSYISGYAVKQGAVRKNWKKRYFILNDNGLSYFKHDQDREPIKTIPLTEIMEAKLVAGQHHPHRQNLFEVYTAERNYNIQCDTLNESENWISQINKHAKPNVVSSYDYEPVTTFSQTQSLQQQQQQQRPSSQEAIKPSSKAVWKEPKHSTLPADGRTKQNFSGSKKSWHLW
ncbi:Pleckstrin y domain-containing A member 1 [Mactra antiquata]